MAAGKLTSRFGDGNSSVGGSWDRGPFGAATSGFSPGPRFCCFRRHHSCIVYGTASNTNLRQLDSIHSTGLRLALGAFCTSPVSSLYTDPNEAPLEERRLKLSMHYYLKTRACIDNPAHHALHESNGTTRELYVPKPNGRGGMTRPPAYPIGHKVEAAMASAEVKVESVCPLITPSIPPGTHDYDPRDTTSLKEWTNVWSPARKPRLSSMSIMKLKIKWRKLYWWLQNERESGGSGSHQPPFPGCWDNLMPPFIKDCQTTAPSLLLRQQPSHWYWTNTSTWAQFTTMWWSTLTQCPAYRR